MNEDRMTLTEENDALLPEGWSEDVDIFRSGWESAGAVEEGPETAPTTEPEGGTPDGAAPTTEHTPSTGKLRFTARVDHTDRDVELDEHELPALYQKAQATERAQARLARLAPRVERAEQAAKALGYRDLDGMLEAAGEPPAVHGRDLRAEVRQLAAARPDLRGKSLPAGVIRDSVASGKPLLAALAEYEAGQHKARADRLRRENEILKQNAASAAKAPIRAATGGGATDTRPKDDFLAGFDDE